MNNRVTGFIALILFMIRETLCWHEMGHLLVARIAEKKLQKENPSVLEKTYEQLKPIESFFAERGNSLLEPSLAPDLFMDQFHLFLMDYHFVDNPLLYKNDKPSDITFNDVKVFNATYAFKNGVDIIKESLNPETKDKHPHWYIKNGLIDSIMLRYIIHIAGDSHQPLHACSFYSANLYNGSLKQGDQGGNLIPIKDVFNMGLTNLHSLWDSVLGKYEHKVDLPLCEKDIKNVDTLADELMQRYTENYFGRKVNNIKIDDWFNESFGICKDFVYSDIDIFPTIRPQYIATGRDIAEKRIALAGYRLANVLKDIYSQKTEASVL